MNVFNGRLDLLSVTPVQDEPTQWDVTVNFNDNTGLYYASDMAVGDVIYNDVSSLNMGLSRYRIILIEEGTDFSTANLRVEWALPDDPNFPMSDPYCGYDSIVGRTLLGTVFLPPAAAQGVSEDFIHYARSVELFLSAKYSYNNRVFDAPYHGELDGFNLVFTTVTKFISGTLQVRLSGLTLQLGVDYTVNGNDITLAFPPTSDYNLVVDMNPL